MCTVHKQGHEISIADQFSRVSSPCWKCSAKEFSFSSIIFKFVRCSCSFIFFASCSSVLFLTYSFIRSLLTIISTLGSNERNDILLPFFFFFFVTMSTWLFSIFFLLVSNRVQRTARFVPQGNRGVNVLYSCSLEEAVITKGHVTTANH